MTVISTQTIKPWLGRASCCKHRKDHITVSDLSVCYDNKPALHHVNLAMHRGCITAIIGPSGCGKSTFLSCLNRMTDLLPTCHVTGTIHVDGHNIFDKRADLIQLRRQVGMIFQRPNPLPLSIRKNLAFPLKQHGMKSRGQRMTETKIALQRVGLWEEVKDRLNAPAMRLSGGQQQRLCIARALVLSPEILLMDEPCSALDPIASGVVEDLIASLRSQYTVVVVTHNLAQARRLADDVAMFWVDTQSGVIIEQGPVQKVFESPVSPITAAYLRGDRG